MHTTAPHLSTHLALYFEDLSARSAPSYVSRAQGAWRSLQRELGDPLVADLEVASVLTYRSRRLAQGVTKTTVNLEVWHLKAFLRWLVEMGKIEGHPVLAMRKLRVREADQRRRRRALGEQEVTSLLLAALARDHRTNTRRGARRVPQAPLWRAFIETGLRRAEACALRWAHVDLEERWFFITAASSKSGRSRRVPITAQLARELADMRASNSAILGRLLSREDHVFLSPLGRPWWRCAENLNRELRRLLLEAGIEQRDADGRGLSVHALRHTCATRLARTAPTSVVQALLGHADPQTTLSVYTHAEAEDLARAVDHLDPAGPTRSYAPATESEEPSDPLRDLLLEAWPTLSGARRLAALLSAGLIGLDLSASHREVYELAAVQGLPYADVAARLGVPEGTVKSRMHYAMRKLSQEAPAAPQPGAELVRRQA